MLQGRWLRAFLLVLAGVSALVVGLAARDVLRVRADIASARHDLSGFDLDAVDDGADLVALAQTEGLGIRRRIVLPFSPERFRASSVTDRPGEWGPVFDRLTREAIKSSDLIVLEEEAPDDSAGYESANRRIIDEALRLTPPGRDPMAVLVWEGASRGDDDLTAAFGRDAARRGFEVVHVPTL